jgi:pimeloyl-ACP methyl ester carboxylesterase
MTTSEDQVREESLWFGDEDRPLFGRLSSPLTQSVRGGVLISPPIGREARLARRALRTLAFNLAIDGYVTLRFDHFATGDSSGSFDEDDFDTVWLHSIDQGVALLRSLGVSSVSAVGMRMGATILGAAAGAYDMKLASAVLWDPCESGRTYLRESSALGSIGRDVVAPDTSEPVQMLEFAYGEQASARISALNLLAPTREPLGGRVLVVARDDRVISSKFKARWAQDVEWVSTSQQAEHLDTELPLSVQPTLTIGQIREWLTASDAPLSSLGNYERARAAVVVKSPNVFQVQERVVELGPNKLFGILSEPVGDVKSPLIVLVSGFNEDHVGPSRLWVELSRVWAGYGLRCIRFDFRELGESPWVPSQPTPSVFSKTLNEDIQNVINDLSPTNPAESVLIGLCSGARLALEVAMAHKSRGVCMINPQVGTRLIQNADRMEKSDRESIRSVMKRFDSLLKRNPWVGDVARQVERLVIPNATSPKVRASLGKDGTEMLLLASISDFSPFPWIPIVGSIDRRRLVSSPHYRVEVLPGMDHDLLADLPRARAVAILERHVLEKFADTALPSV